MRILIVDDDEAMAQLLTSICKSDGHQAKAFGSSLEALAHLDESETDLLITDIAMAPPDGLELVRTARARQPGLMAIAVTGYWGRYTLPEVLATGAMDLIFKPFRVEELRARLAMAAERQRMALEEKSRGERRAVSLDNVRVLLIDDSPEDAQSLRKVLDDPSGGIFDIMHLKDLDEAMGLLGREGMDVILLDLDIPGSAGVDTVKRVHAAAPGVPLVALTTRDGDRAAATRVLQAGAQDYVVKGRLNEHPLQRVILHAIERQRLLADSEDIRHQQQQLREDMVLRELHLKDEFMSHVSHELRSPLTAVRQFSGILMDGLAGPLNDEQADALRVIMRNVHQLEAMIDDLLEVTRMQTGKLSIELQSVLPAEVVEDTIDTLGGVAQAKGVILVSEVAEDLPTVYADPVRSRQILINLVDNAIKFTPELGTVTVRALRDSDPNFVLFEVKDEGCGMSEESTERIFERLYQVKQATAAGRKGLGLGLFICKELVDLQGGRIWVTSILDKGSHFRFTLPVFGPGTPLTTRDINLKKDLLVRVTGRTDRLSATEGKTDG